MLLISQNKKISAEIQLLMGRDAEIRNILERDAHLQDVRYENHQTINDSLEKIKIFMSGDVRINNEDINNINNSQNIPQSNPQMSQISQSRMKRPNTYSMEQNRNLNRSQNEEPGIISNMGNNYNNNINNSNINMSLSGSGSRINQVLNSNINNLNKNSIQGQGDEEEMINMEENEQQNEQQNEEENQNEEEYEQEQNNN